METNPFFSDSPKPMNSGKPVKFAVSVNSKLIKNPYLLPKKTPQNDNFIGPKLPNASSKSNGTPSRHLSCAQNGPIQPNSANGNATASPASAKPTEPDDKVNPEKTNGSSASVGKCAASLSSLDLLKSSYRDDSDNEASPYQPNAQPVLTLRRKKKTSESKPTVFERLKEKVIEMKPSASGGATKDPGSSSGNVFERLGDRNGVKSWSGEDSANLLGNGDWSATVNPNKRARDDYDEELDQGRLKKVKQNKNYQNRDQKLNFQKAHEYNKNQKRWEDRKSWGNQNKSPKYFWKNKKHKI